MRCNFFRNKLERDFEFFVRNIAKLEPVEFCGIANLLGVPTLRGLHEIGVKVEDLKGKTEDETKDIVDSLVVPMEDVLERMMDKYLILSKRRRKEINQILIDTQRGA